MLLKREFLSSLILILLVITPTSGGTRSNSIRTFLDSVRISQEGFANTSNDLVTVETTTKVLTISNFISYKPNNTLDILLYYQRSQNTNGGFGANPLANSSWDATISSIRGLWELNINNTQLSDWGIDKYLNQSANELFYEEAVKNNQSVILNNKLTLDLIIKWEEYIFGSVLIGVIPPIPNVFLSSNLKDFQFPNGTYPSFDFAVQSVKLLNTLAQVPNDVELASKFIRAFVSSDSMFSSTLDGEANLEDTFFALRALESLNKLSELENQKKIILKILDLQKANSGFTGLNNNIVSVQSTWYSIQILAMLNSIEELLSPDILQTQGFVSTSLAATVLGIGVVAIYRRKFK